MTDNELSPSAKKVSDHLAKLDIQCKVIELSHSTRTAPEAALAVNCEIGQIVKSLVFIGNISGQPILILASGSNRVNETMIAEIQGEEIQRATPEFVREKTGFAIGGVPPVGFPSDITTLVDQDLLQYDLVWAAAGTPHALFSIPPDDLVRAAKGRVVKIH